MDITVSYKSFLAREKRSLDSPAPLAHVLLLRDTDCLARTLRCSACNDVCNFLFLSHNFLRADNPYLNCVSSWGIKLPRCCRYHVTLLITA